MLAFGVNFDIGFTGSREVPDTMTLDEARDHLEAEFACEFDEVHLISGEYLRGASFGSI